MIAYIAYFIFLAIVAILLGIKYIFKQYDAVVKNFNYKIESLEIRSLDVKDSISNLENFKKEIKSFNLFNLQKALRTVEETKIRVDELTASVAEIVRNEIVAERLVEDAMIEFEKLQEEKRKDLLDKLQLRDANSEAIERKLAILDAQVHQVKLVLKNFSSSIKDF